DVLLARLHADEAFAAPALLAIRLECRALDVAGVRRGDDDVLVFDQVFDTEVACGFSEVRATGVAEIPVDRAQLVDNDADDQLLTREDLPEPRDELHQLGELVEDLLALEAGQALQLHVENRLRLDRRETEPRHEASLRLERILRPADELDDFVEVVERD